MLKRLSGAFLAFALLFSGAAHGQSSGTVTNHAFLLGKGPGTSGYTSLLCGSAQLAVGQTAADPICRTLSGDVTLAATGVTTIGATRVTSAMLNADVYSTAHSWSGQQTFVAPILGTPASGTLTNATGLPISTGVAGLGTGVATFLATPSSANLRAALTDESGSGAALFAGGDLGTPSAGVLTNATGLPVGGIASIAANTIVANVTGSAASPAASNPSTWTQKASPTTSDLIPIVDVAASNALKHATIADVVGAIGSGVTSIGTQVGSITLDGGNLASTVLTVPRYDAAQSLSAGQQLQARQNIGARSRTLLSSVAPTLVTHDFTLPTGVRQFTATYANISTNGTGIPMLQFGDAGGIETSGYTGSAQSGTTSVLNNSVNGILTHVGAAATTLTSGSITCTLNDTATNLWACSGTTGQTDAASVAMVGGHKALSQELTTVRYTTSNGTSVYDSGLLNILYEAP